MVIEQYLADAAKYPLISAEKELETARRARAGDSASRDLLINSNLLLVVCIAKSYSRDDNLDDLIQHGNLALVRAQDRFDPEKGVRFSTYAYDCVEKEIWSYFEGQEKIKLPPKERALRRKIYGIRSQYFVSNGKEPSAQNIADELNRQQTKKVYTAKDIQTLLQTYERLKMESLNRFVGSDEDAESGDFISGADGKDIVEDISNRSIADLVHTKISELKIEDGVKTVLERALYEHKPFNEIAMELGIKTTKVKQQYSKGLRLLKITLRNEGISIENST